MIDDKAASEFASVSLLSALTLSLLRLQAAAEIQALYRLFVAVDATQVEINPLIETPQGQVVAVDAKIQVSRAARSR